MLHNLNSPDSSKLNISLQAKFIHSLRTPPASSTSSLSNLILIYFLKFIKFSWFVLLIKILCRSTWITSHPCYQFILNFSTWNLSHVIFYWKYPLCIWLLVKLPIKGGKIQRGCVTIWYLVSSLLAGTLRDTLLEWFWWAWPWYFICKNVWLTLSYLDLNSFFPLLSEASSSYYMG